jgi:hypothetical protein
MYFVELLPSNYRKQRLVDDINKEETTNNKNGRNRKICPITYAELNTDNSVKIGKTIYSSSGLKQLFDHRLPDQKLSDFWENYYIIRSIKDPMTNVPFTDGNARDICILFLSKFER